MGGRRRGLGDPARERRGDRVAVVARRQRHRGARHRRGADERRQDHGSPRCLLGACPGRAARPDPVVRAPRRLRPAECLAPDQRVGLSRPGHRPRGVLGLGLRAARPLLAPEGDLHHARRRHLPRDDHGHCRNGLDDRRRRDVRRDREAAAPLRGLVRGPHRRVRSHRAGLVPPDSDRQRARARPVRRRLLARPVPGHAGVPRRVPPRAAGRGRLSPPPPRRGRGSRGAGRGLGADHRAAPRAAPGPAGAVLPLALPRPAALVVVAPVLALGGARRPEPEDHGQGAGRLLRRPRHALARHAGRRGGPARPLHRGCPPARQGRPDRGRHRHHAGARARGEDGRGRRARLPRRP